MRTLWHRAAQTRSTCKCTLCHSATPALSRHTTSANVKRRIRFNDVFTVFYSSILASAAIADVRWKEAKTKNWHKLIEEARNDLKALGDQQQRRLAAISTPEDSAAPIPGPVKDTWHETFAWAARERDRRKALGFQDLKGPSLDLLEGLSTPEIEELVLDKYIARLNSKDGKHLWDTTDASRKLSIKKVKTLEWSIRKLAHQLILSCVEKHESPKRDGGVLEVSSPSRHYFAGMDSDQLKTKLDQCAQRLSFLARHSSNPEYWYRFKSPKAPIYSCWPDVRRERADSLNIKLHTIFKYFRGHTMEKDTLVASICSALLTSYVPPDVYTYNLLIAGLTKLKQMDDVKAVIASMYECHIRPNEVTLCALLHYYTITDNSIAFLRLLGKMEGRSGGLSVANAATEINQVLRDRYQPRRASPKKRVTISEGEEDYYYEIEGYRFQPRGRQPRAECHGAKKIVETARMMIINRAVYGALIHAALRFLNPSRAMAFYRQMLADGWEAGKRELGDILRHCCEKLEWHGALAVWQEMCKLPQGPDKIALGQMLHLCRRRRKHVEFGQLLDYGVRHQLVPSTIWSFPRLASGGEIGNILHSADVLMSAKQLAFPITIARDFIERNLEFLGYRMAKTALDLAEIGLSLSIHFDGMGLKLYLRIIELHQHSPARSAYTARNVVFQGLRGRLARDSKLQSGHTDYDKEIERVPLTCHCCGAECLNALQLHMHLMVCSATGAATEDATSSLSHQARKTSQPTSTAEELPVHSQAPPSSSQQAEVLNPYRKHATVGIPENKDTAYNQGLQPFSSKAMVSTSVAHIQAPQMLESPHSLGSKHEETQLNNEAEMTSQEILSLSEHVTIDRRAYATDFEKPTSSADMSTELGIPFHSDLHHKEPLAILPPSPLTPQIAELEQHTTTIVSSDQASDLDQWFLAHPRTSSPKHPHEYLERRPSKLRVHLFYKDQATPEQPQAYSTMASSHDNDTPRDEWPLIRYVRARAPIAPRLGETEIRIRRCVSLAGPELRNSESVRPPVNVITKARSTPSVDGTMNVCRRVVVNDAKNR